MKRAFIFTTVFTLFVSLPSCSHIPSVNLFQSPSKTSTSALLQSLRERGLVLLSTTSPNVAANECVAALGRESASIDGFLKTKGLPNGIMVTGQPEASDIIEFLYLNPIESYTLESIEQQWVILGPVDMSADQKSRIMEKTSDNDGKPLVTGYPIMGIDSKNKTEEMVAEQATKEMPNEVAMKQSLYDKISSRNAVAKKTAPASTEMKTEMDETSKKSDLTEEASIPSEAKSLNQAQSETITKRLQSLRQNLKSKPANLSPSGAIKHTISSEAETLSVLSLWYTADAGNATTLARLNNKEESEALEIGDSILIPRGLADTTLSFPIEAIEMIKGLSDAAGK